MPLAWGAPIDSLASLKHPISIAGGGLAGLSLGIALQSRGVSVTLHEASTYPRHRVCGEFISGVGGGNARRAGHRRLSGGGDAPAKRLLERSGG